MAEGFEQAAHRVGQGLALGDELGAGDQEQTQRAGVHALDRDLAIPARAYDLGEAERVIGVGLFELKFERGLGVAGVEADHGQAHPAQAVGEPVGELPRLQADPHEGRGVLVQRVPDRLRSGSALAAPEHGAPFVDDTDGGGAERHVKAGVVLLGCGLLRIHGVLRVVLMPAERSAAAFWVPVRDYAMSRPPLSRAPRASAVQEAAQRHRCEPARSVLDGASTVLCSSGREGVLHTGRR